MEIGKAFVSILPSAKGFGRKLQSDVGGETGGAGKTLGMGFGKAFGAAAGVVAAAGVGSFLKSSISSAGDLEQSIGAVDAIFKGSAKQIHAWSKQSATSVGLTRNEFNELGTLIGAQLKNGGTAMDELAPKTNDLIKMGADLSSMFGGSTREAVEALSSALKGERDPIERYGVSLNQAKIDAEAAALGFEKVGGSLSSEAQQAATLSLITKQTADAHGNFAREADTLAHQQQVLSARWGDMKTQLGTALLPVVTRFVGLLNDNLSPAVDGVRGAFKAAVSTIAGVWDRIQPLVSGLRDALAPVLERVLNFLKKNPTVVKAFAIALGGLAAAIGVVTLATTAFSIALNSTGIPLIIVGIAALVASLVYAYQHSARFRAIAQQVGTVIKTQVVPMVASLARWFAGSLLPAVLKVANTVGQRLRPIFDQLVKTFRTSVLPTLQRLIAKFREWQPTIQKVIVVVVRIIGTLLKFAATVLARVLPPLIRFAGFIISTVVPAISRVIGWIAKWIGIQIRIGTALFNAGRKAVEFGQTVLSAIRAIPGAVGNLGHVLYNAGVQLIQGLINGITDKVRDLKAKLGEVTSIIPDWKGPAARDRKLLTPAGRMIMQGLIAGIDGETQALKRTLGSVTGTIESALDPTPYGGGFVPGVATAHSAGLMPLAAGAGPGPSAGADMASLAALLQRVTVAVTVGADTRTKARWYIDGKTAAEAFA